MEPLLPAWFTALIAGALLILVLVVIYKLVADEVRVILKERQQARLRADMREKFRNGTGPIVLSEERIRVK